MTVLVVGEDFGNADARYHNDLYALTGGSGRRLAELCGYEGEGTLPVLQFCQAFDRTNVVTLASEWRDREAVEDGVRRIVRRVIEMNFLGASPEIPRLVLLGARVSRAFRLEHMPIFEVDRVLSTGNVEGLAVYDCVRAPHPSGRSHWWNDPANVDLARAFWAEQRAVAEGES